MKDLQKLKVRKIKNQKLNDGYFFDWLSMSQLHEDKNLPIVASKIKTVEDLETGEIILTRLAMQHEGSFSTSINITCDGNRVSVSGNPSKFNRSDNLFGYEDLNDCVALYNKMLAVLNLPPFTITTKVIPTWNDKIKDFNQTPNGAVIRQVHVTKNYFVGKGNEKNFIRSLGSYAYRSKLPMIYPDGNTIDWNAGSRTLYMKLYNKTVSMTRERKKLCKTYSVDELAYYDKVLNYCNDNGVVRLEYEYKSNFLATRNLRFYGVGDMGDLLKFRFIEDKIEKMENVVTDFNSIADELLCSGIVKSTQAANATQSYFYMWLHGQDIRNTINKSQFYVHRNRLLMLGYDISDQINVSAMPIRVKNNSILSISEAIIPDWYHVV